METLHLQSCPHFTPPRERESKLVVRSYPPPLVRKFLFSSLLLSLFGYILLVDQMEEVLRSNKRRVYPIQPHASLYTHFSQKYMGYLLPALLQVTNGGSKENDIEKKVRFEVDMALVLSAGGFRWSRALQRTLEQDRSTTRPHRSITMGVLGTKGSDTISIPRPLVPAEVTRPRRVCGSWRSMKALRGKEKMLCRVRVLRRILPGGSEMDVHELLSEVESYVVHLQLQVNILRSLVAAH